jgi:hypothetical protein
MFADIATSPERLWRNAPRPREVYEKLRWLGHGEVEPEHADVDRDRLDGIGSLNLHHQCRRISPMTRFSDHW